MERTARRILAWVSIELVVAGDAALEAGDALADGGFAQLAQLLGSAGAGVIVAAHAAGVEGSAQELVDGQAEDLAADVPEGLVDAGDGGAHDGAGAIEAVDVHGLPVVLDLHGVAADQEVAEIVDAGDGGAGFAFQRGFAPANDAGVGFELDEDVGAVGFGRERDSEDFHAGDLRIPEPTAAEGVCAERLRGSQRSNTRVASHGHASQVPDCRGIHVVSLGTLLVFLEASSLTSRPRPGPVGSPA